MGLVRVPSSTTPGFRDYGRTNVEGVARFSGDYGYNWSSSVDATNGMCLYFYSTWIDPCRAFNRAFGHQLLCLSE